MFLRFFIIALTIVSSVSSHWIAELQDGTRIDLINKSLVQICDVYPSDNNSTSTPLCFLKNTSSTSQRDKGCTELFYTNSSLVDATSQLAGYYFFTPNKASTCFCEAKRTDCPYYVDGIHTKRVVDLIISTSAFTPAPKNFEIETLNSQDIKLSKANSAFGQIMISIPKCVHDVVLALEERNGTSVSRRKLKIPVNCIKKRSQGASLSMEIGQFHQKVEICSPTECFTIWTLEKSFRQALEESCLSGNCVACDTLLYKGACLTKHFGAWIVASTILSAIITVILCVLIIKFLASCTCRCKCCPRKTGDVEMEAMLTSSNASSNVINITVPSAPSAAPFIPLLMIALLFFPFAIACTSNVIASSSIPYCTRYNASSIVCQTKPVLALAMGGAGSETCIQVLDGNNDVGLVKVKTVSQTFHQSLYKAYFTTDWSGYAESKSICFYWFNNLGCDNSHPNCETYYSEGAVENPFGFFSAQSVNNPGKTICDGSVWACGDCFVCTNRCIYGRASLLQTPNSWQIMSPGQRSLVTTISVTLPDGTVASSSTSGNSIDSNDFTLTMIGTFQDTALTWNSKKIAVRGSTAYLVDASETNLPQARSIGDIQSDTDTFMSSPKSSVFARDFYTYTASSLGLTYSFPASGISQLSGYPSFPMSFSGYQWNYEDGILYGDVFANWNTIATLTFKRNLTYFISDLATCPEATFLSVEGCYNCPYRSSFTFFAKSSCYEGYCTLVSDLMLSTTSINLGVVDQTYNVTFYSSNATVSSNVTILCKEFSKTFRVFGELVDFDSVHVNQNETTITPPNPGKGSFFGLPGVFDDLILSAIIIASGIILIVITLFVVKKILECKAKRAMSFAEAFKQFGTSNAYAPLPEQADLLQH